MDTPTEPEPSASPAAPPVRQGPTAAWKILLTLAGVVLLGTASCGGCLYAYGVYVDARNR